MQQVQASRCVPVRLMSTPKYVFLDRRSHGTNLLYPQLTRSNMFVYNYRAEKLPTSYPLLKPKSNKFNHGILEVQLKDYDQGDETFSDDRIKRVS